MKETSDNFDSELEDYSAEYESADNEVNEKDTFKQ